MGGLRFSIGVFKISPIASQLSLTGEPSLHFCRIKLILKYIARIISTPENSTIHFLNKKRFSTMHKFNSKLRKPLGPRLQKRMKDINIVFNEIRQHENSQMFPLGNNQVT